MKQKARPEVARRYSVCKMREERREVEELRRALFLTADEAQIQSLSYQSRSKDESSGGVTDNRHPSTQHRFPGMK